MREITCSNCHKHLFMTERSQMGAVIEARDRGYIGKLLTLYGHNKPEYFCSVQCFNTWKEKNIIPDKKMDKVLNEMKKDTPVIAARCADGLKRIIDRYGDNLSRMKSKE